MVFPNPDLVVNIILPSLIGGTVGSALSGLVLGSGAGWVMGAIARQPKTLMWPSMVGCFLGTLLGCVVPIASTPGLVNGGPYAFLLTMMLLVVLLPSSVILGTAIGSLLALKTQLFTVKGRKWLLVIVLAAYVLAFAAMYARITVECLRPNTVPLFCEQAGFP